MVPPRHLILSTENSPTMVAVERRRPKRSPALRRPPPLLIVIAASLAVVPTSPFGIGICGIHASKPAASLPASLFSVGTASATRSSGGISSVSSSHQSSQNNESEGQLGDNDWRAAECNATLASKLMYTYVDKLLDVAAERKLEQSDAFHVPSAKLMKNAVLRLETRYSKARNKARRRLQELQAEVEVGEVENIDDGSGETSRRSNLLRLGRRNKRRRKPRKRDRLATSQTIVLAKALLQSQKQTLQMTGILRLLNTAVQSLPALLIARLLRQIEAGTTMPPSQPLRTAASLVGILLVKMIVENAYFHNVVKCACEVRGALAGMIFDKSLVLPNSGGGATLTSSSNENEGGDDNDNADGEGSNGSKKTAKASAGSGQVLNLVQTDTATIESLTLQLHTIWDGLLQIALYTTLLYRYLGTSVLYGIAVLLTTIPLNSVVLRVLNKLTKQENAAKDERFRRTTEAISNMKLLKLFGSWTSVFSGHIEESRDEQMKRRQKKGSVRALNQAFSNAVPVISLVVTLGHYARSGQPIVASTIFASISLFNQCKYNGIDCFQNCNYLGAIECNCVHGYHFLIEFRIHIRILQLCYSEISLVLLSHAN